MASAPSIPDRIAALEDACRSRGRVIIAYSGGVDSGVIAAIATRALGENALAVLVRSESVGQREIDAAVENARAMGIRLRVIDHSELADPNYAANPTNRCYFCRQGLADVLFDLAAQEGFKAVAVGTVTDDEGDWRPGLKALREAGAWQPLLEQGIDKDTVRAIGRHLDLPVAEKPSMACLSSRIPYGDPVTEAKLRRIEAAEDHLRDLGFQQVRVRHHGDLARIEVERHEIPRLEAPATRAGVEEAFRAIGYLRVEIDSEGYRTGSLNEGVTTGLAGIPIRVRTGPS